MITENFPSSLKRSIKNKNHYRILVLSDLHIPIDMDLKEQVLNSKILKGIDYAVLLGDNIASYGEDTEYKRLNAFLTKFPIPYVAINGNHEFMFKVQRFGSKTYGKIWRENSQAEKRKQLLKFYRFFNIKTPYWHEKNSDTFYIFLTIGDPATKKVEVLPAGGEKFLQKILRNISKKDTGNIFVFCHAPLNGSQVEGFRYYTEDKDPFIYLNNNTLELINKTRVCVYWVSGHIHLDLKHPMSLVRKVRNNLYQINCPPSWRWSRKTLKDIIPKKYEGFHSVVLDIAKGNNILKVYNWFKKKFVKELKI